jgi:hypothetical protein
VPKRCRISHFARNEKVTSKEDLIHRPAATVPAP